ncbi:7056_t:CDS:10, partial [Racocetra persica]
MSKTVLDVSGYFGNHGQNGSHASIASSGWKNGNHGNNATNPTRGGDAGDIDLNLAERDSIIGASIAFSGKYRERAPGYAIRDYQNTLSCTNVNMFVLNARGGDGGNGGIGGDGGNGAMGSRGIDATRYTSGTNGGRGGDGGNAGAGTSGVAGGNGGRIILRMNDTDAGLLLLFVNSWTPRGFSGPSGSNGVRPTFPLYNGAAGANGAFRFMIKNSFTDIVTEYNEIFDIRLNNVITHSTTGAYEPEAIIIIDYLTVRNTSSMPTPRRDIRININDRTWIHNQRPKEHIVLPNLIDKHSYRDVNCSQPFSFRLKGHIVNKPGPPLRATDSLFFTATMTGLERMLPAFNLIGHPINIQFPIELTQISHMNSMVVGHVTKVIWNVTNTSKVDFGALSNNKRLICVRLCKIGGEVSSSALKFGLIPYQKGVSIIPPVQTMENEYIFDIPLLKAGKTLRLEATLTLTEAEAFEYAEFWLYLELGKINEPSSPKIVHIQSFDVRVSTIYRGFPQGFYPDVLLVANHKTARNEYLAWVKLFKKVLGLGFFIWDISQMGHFGLMRDIKTLYSVEPTTLMKDLAEKTMIILDNGFEYGDNRRKVTALNFVLKNEWME